MTKVKQLEIANACYAMVSGYFADQVWENRAPDYWLTFANKMAEHCETMIHVYVSHNQKTAEEVKGKAKEYGREIAERLVSGFMEGRIA